VASSSSSDSSVSVTEMTSSSCGFKGGAGGWLTCGACEGGLVAAIAIAGERGANRVRFGVKWVETAVVMIVAF